MICVTFVFVGVLSRRPFKNLDIPGRHIASRLRTIFVTPFRNEIGNVRFCHRLTILTGLDVFLATIIIGGVKELRRIN